VLLFLSERERGKRRLLIIKIKKMGKGQGTRNGVVRKEDVGSRDGKKTPIFQNPVAPPKVT